MHALTMCIELTGKIRSCRAFTSQPACDGRDARRRICCRVHACCTCAANRKRFGDRSVRRCCSASPTTTAVSPFWEALGRKFFRWISSEAELEIGGAQPHADRGS